MQKKIIVLALAAAFSAPAFADTTVYGVVDVAAASIAASGTKNDLSVHSSGLAGSRLGVKSSEDLSDGMKASIVIEYGLDATTGAAMGNARQTFVAIDGNFGKVAAGYIQTTGYDFSRFDPTNGSLITPLGNITGKANFLVGNSASLKRLARSIAYTSPNMGDVNVVANYSTAADTTTDLGVASTSSIAKSTAYMVSANYAAGPLAAAVVYANKTAAVDVAGLGGAKTSETAIGASYDLGMAKLFATYQVNKVDTNNDSDKAMSVSASAPFGASTVVLTYAKGTMSAQGTDKDASGFTAAYLNSLSKTTTFYAAYSTMSQGSASRTYSVAGNAAATTAMDLGANSSMIVAGLNKKF
jgi:predicted porin